MGNFKNKIKYQNTYLKKINLNQNYKKEQKFMREREREYLHFFVGKI